MRSSYFFIALLSLQACDAARDVVDPARVEAELREDPTRPGKVGSIVAVGVHQRATRTARSVSLAPDPRCALDPRRGTRWTMELELRRRRADKTVASWTETRELVIAAGGATELTSRARYTTELGLAGDRALSWRSLDGTVWHGSKSTGGWSWHRRDAEGDERERFLAAGPGAFQALLDAVGGWTATSDDTWSHGSDPLRCVRHDEGTAFVDRFVAQARVVSAELSASSQERVLQGEWRLQDGSTIEADVRDTLIEEFAEIPAPPAEQIVSTRRDRSLPHANALLESLVADRLARDMSPPEPEDETTDD